MNKTKKIAIGIVSIVVAAGVLFVSGALIYRVLNTQGVVTSYTINQDNAEQSRILIATQQRDFKDSVMAEIANYYADKSVYISVIDVTALDTVNSDEWNGIILFTTIQSDNPPQIVMNFLEKQKDLSNKFLMLTAQSGQWRHPNTTGVDVVTSASLKSNIGDISETIIEKIDEFIMK